MQNYHWGMQLNFCNQITKRYDLQNRREQKLPILEFRWKVEKELFLLDNYKTILWSI